MRDRRVKHGPTFCLRELHGKTLTMHVGEDYNAESGMRYTVVIGADELGNKYVIVDKREQTDVHPE